MEKNENRNSVIWRKYGKGPDEQMIFVYLRTGQEITGEVFEFAVFLNNQEIKEKRNTSGDKLYIRRVYENHLRDLADDGWQRRGGGTGSPEHAKFFDTESL